MKKIISILFLCILLSGCAGIIPRITTDTPNTVPQITQKSKVKEICKGKAEWDEMGNIKSCSKGYFNYESGYNKQERRMTIVERIKSFINGLAGWGFIGLILLVIFCPSLIGVILGRFIEGSIGIGKKALTQISSAIQKVKDKSPELINALETSTDEDVKKFIADFKQKNGIK